MSRNTPVTVTDNVTLAALGSMDLDSFVRTLGDVFEHSPWVAESAWTQRPFGSLEAMHQAMMAAVRGAPAEVQLRFLNLHPELKGAEAQAGTMTAHSTAEQSGGGMQALSAAEVAELRRLNAVYARRHGFPFIIEVLGHTKTQIFEALARRIDEASADELAAALGQVERITRRRLRKLVAEA